MAAPLTGLAVRVQAEDDSILNSEPAVATGAVVGVVGAVGAIAVIGGWLDQGAADALKEQAGIIVPALFIIAGILQGLLTRIRAYSPRTAAKIAVVNASALPGAAPTLLTTPP